MDFIPNYLNEMKDRLDAIDELIANIYNEVE